VKSIRRRLIWLLAILPLLAGCRPLEDLGKIIDDLPPFSRRLQPSPPQTKTTPAYSPRFRATSGQTAKLAGQSIGGAIT